MILNTWNSGKKKNVSSHYVFFSKSCIWRGTLYFVYFIAHWREFKFRFLWLQVTKTLLPLESYIFTEKKKKMFSNLSFFSLTSSITFSAPDSYPFVFLTLSHFTLTHDSLTWYSWCPPVFFFSVISFLASLFTSL